MKAELNKYASHSYLLPVDDDDYLLSLTDKLYANFYTDYRQPISNLQKMENDVFDYVGYGAPSVITIIGDFKKILAWN